MTMPAVFAALKQLLGRRLAGPSIVKATMRILHIDSSILGRNSASRILSAEVVARLTAATPAAEVEYLDLAAERPLHLTGSYMAAVAGADVGDPAVADDFARGNAYIDQLIGADIIVIGLPMYNFSIPSQLKAWIDHVVIRGRTFRYGEKGPEGLLPPGKKVFLASSRGGVYSAGSPAAFLEHQESYLRGILGFIGLRDVTVVRAEGVNAGPEARQAAIASARAEIAALAV